MKGVVVVEWYLSKVFIITMIDKPGLTKRTCPNKVSYLQSAVAHKYAQEFALKCQIHAQHQQPYRGLSLSLQVGC